MPGNDPVQNFSGEKLLLLLGNGQQPEAFTASATINTTRSFDITAKASVTEIADTVNPSLPASTVRQTISTDVKFTGSGIADSTGYFMIANAALQGTVLDVKVMTLLTGAQGGVTWTGKMIVTNCQLAGNRGDMATFTATFEQAAPGALTQNA